MEVPIRPEPTIFTGPATRAVLTALNPSGEQ